MLDYVYHICGELGIRRGEKRKKGKGKRRGVKRNKQKENAHE
jgi:hypothetical protein